MALILSAVMLLGTLPLSASAASSAEIQKQLNGLKAQNAEIQKQIEAAESAIKDLEAKLEKLMKFYSDGLNEIGWNKYKKLNIEFDKKVIGTTK